MLVSYIKHGLFTYLRETRVGRRYDKTILILIIVSLQNINVLNQDSRTDV